MILELLTAVVGIVMSLAYFPQAYKIYKSKSAKDISLLSYSIFCVGTVLWTVYGFYIHDWVLIASFIVGVAGSWSVMGLTLYYRKSMLESVGPLIK